MAHSLINKEFYDAILQFNRSEKARDYYYKIMDTETGKTRKDGKPEKIRDQILRVYGKLFCEDLPAETLPGVEEVSSTADRLHVGAMSYDPKHWYRMQYGFPIIDEDNYDRFAALVIADMNAGPLREAAVDGGDTLLVGEGDPLHMTSEERAKQKVRIVAIGG